MSGRLSTVRVDCPACGGSEVTRTWTLPGQFLAHRQSFLAARCTCGHAYLKEQVVAEEQARLYERDYPLHRGPGLFGPFAPLVAAADARTDRRRVQAVRRARRLGPEDRVLDLACGRGSFLQRLHRETGVRGVGVDAVAPAEADGTPWAAAPGAPIRCVSGTMAEPCSVVEREAPFSAVTLWHALEHDPAPAQTLAWVRRCLRSDGALVIEVPDHSSQVARRFGAHWGGYHTPRHVSFFEPESLARLVEQAGFSLVERRRHGTLVPFTMVALGLASQASVRFSDASAWTLFAPWTLGLFTTWPWLGRPCADGLGLQLLIARPR